MLQLADHIPILSKDQPRDEHWKFDFSKLDLGQENYSVPEAISVCALLTSRFLMFRAVGTVYEDPMSMSIQTKDSAAVKLELYHEECYATYNVENSAIAWRNEDIA